MTNTNTSADRPERRSFDIHWISRKPATTLLWMGAAFLIALALAVIVLAVFGQGDRGTRMALRVTAEWSFLLFWLAYTGSAMAKVFGPRFDGWGRRGRDLGLSFASAHLVHVGLVLWLFHISAEPPLGGGAPIFFSAGLFCTYLLALFSLPRLREALGPRLWQILRTIALEYIALVFATDFIVSPLQAVGIGQFPRSYLPFALMLIGGVGLRIAAIVRGPLIGHRLAKR